MYILERLQRINNLQYTFLLFILWAITQVSLFYSFGVKMPIDSSFYLENADHLLKGNFVDGRSIWYLSYSALLAIVFFLKGGVNDVVLIQVLFSGIAAYCLYFIVTNITENRIAALLTVLLYIAWIKIHQWNFYIYTESFFTSMCIISFAILIRCSKASHYLLIIPLLVFTFLIRPTGFGFIIGIACYSLGSLFNLKFKKKTLISVGILFGVASVVLLNKMLENYILIESYIKAEIIYPNISLGISAPADLIVPSVSYPPIIRLVLFVLQNPIYFIEISSIKFFLFVSNLKPYFSFLHNLLIIIVLWPLYFFAYRGFKLLGSARRVKYFFVGYFLTQTLTVTLTTENWDGRFLVPVLPFVFILSANGLSKILGPRIHAHTLNDSQRVC